MKATEIPTKCGIYDTETIIRDYGYKIIVITPVVIWDKHNTGTLKTRRAKITDETEMKAVRKFAQAEALATDDGDMLAYYID